MQGSSGDADTENRPADPGGGKGQDESRERHGDKYTPCVRGRARAVLHDNLEGWDGLGGGGGARGRGHMYTCV